LWLGELEIHRGEVKCSRRELHGSAGYKEEFVRDTRIALMELRQPHEWADLIVDPGTGLLGRLCNPREESE
jgi:hypothetical protein